MAVSIVYNKKLGKPQYVDTSTGKVVSKSEYKHSKKGSVSTQTEETTISLPEGNWEQQEQNGKIRFYNPDTGGYTAWRTYDQWKSASAKEIEEQAVTKKQVESGEYVKSQVGKSGVRKELPLYTGEPDKDILHQQYKKATGKKVTPDWAEGLIVKPKETTTEKIKRTFKEGWEKTKKEPTKAITDIPSALGTGLLSGELWFGEIATPFKFKSGIYTEHGKQISLREEIEIERQKLSPVGKIEALGMEFTTVSALFPKPIDYFAKVTTKTAKINVVSKKQAKGIAVTDVEKGSKTRRIFSRTGAKISKKEIKAVSESVFVDKPKKPAFGASLLKKEVEIKLGDATFIKARAIASDLKKPAFSFKNPPLGVSKAKVKLGRITEPSGMFIEVRKGAIGVEAGGTLSGKVAGKTAGYNLYVKEAVKPSGSTGGILSKSSAITKSQAKQISKSITGAIQKSTTKLIQRAETKQSIITLSKGASIGVLSKTKTVTKTKQKPIFSMNQIVPQKIQQKSIIKPITQQNIQQRRIIRQKPLVIVRPKVEQRQKQSVIQQQIIGEIQLQKQKLFSPTRPTKPLVPVTPNRPIIGEPIGGLLLPPLILGGGGKGYSWLKRKKKTKARYKPDLYSLFTGYAKKQKPSISTGLEPRPLIRR